MEEARAGLRGRLMLRLAHLYFLATRSMTLGVRALVIDAEQRVLLVRHSYVPGWHFPGGGVERGETLLTSLRRELAEEANVVLTGAANLQGVFHHLIGAGRDHVVLYVVREFVVTGPRAPDREILEAAFFARDALPAGISRASLARLAEVLDGAPRSEVW
jgi:ADP-ribose pyrophosphatase YjhB (NUDIX family)